ncbi:MAG: ferritin [Rhodothermales bacterium]
MRLEGIESGGDFKQSPTSSAAPAKVDLTPTLPTVDAPNKQEIPMLSPNLQAALSKQLHFEFSSAYQYLAMSMYCDHLNLPGFASWMQSQAQEELTHGRKICDFVLDRDAQVEFLPISAPIATFPSLVDMMQVFLDSEISVTTGIHALYAEAVEEKAYEVQMLMQWFITEQIEEEKSARHLTEQLRLIGDNGAALLMLDREMAARAGNE